MHDEFPLLTPEARAAYDAAVHAIVNPNSQISPNDFRRALSAGIREALKQATERNCIFPAWDILAIANNLRSPPPPPTLAEAYAADLDTPEGKAKVRAFLEFYLNDPTELVKP